MADLRAQWAQVGDSIEQYAGLAPQLRARAAEFRSQAEEVTPAAPAPADAPSGDGEPPPDDDSSAAVQ